MKSRVPKQQRVFLIITVVVFTAALTYGPRISFAQTQAESSTNTNVTGVGNPRADAFSFDVWRDEHRIIDLHQHIEANPERFKRAIGILDRSGVGIGVIPGAGTVTAKNGQPSDFEKAKALSDSLYPGRFMNEMILDYGGWDDANWSDRAVEQINEGYRLGAAGLKEYKRLGLFLKDGSGKLIRIDDEKLDPVWRRCGELGMPVSIHVGDPKAFWRPYDAANERWTELKDHRSWWFGDPKKHPARMELLDALNRVIERHPKTMFVCVHFANNPEDLDWVAQSRDRYPNMYADMAARIPEIGRQNPARVRQMFEKYQDRILFATDFMVYNKLILGSGGDAENPTDDDGVESLNALIENSASGRGLMWQHRNRNKNELDYGITMSWKHSSDRNRTTLTATRNSNGHLQEKRWT